MGGMGLTNSTQIKKTFGIDISKSLDKTQEREVTRQMAGFTTPRRIVKGMQFFFDNVQVQRAGAKQLSNLAFNVTNVSTVLQNNGLTRLVKAIKSHMDDYGFPSVHGDATLKLIFETLEIHKGNKSVTTSALGLLANLAIRETVAANLAKYGAIRWVIRGLNIYLDEVGPRPTGENDENRMMLIENGMAALSNLSFVDAFSRHLLLSHGLETLCRIIRSEDDIPLSEEEDGPLLRNILTSVGVNIAQAESKSYELYSFHQVVKMDFDDSDKLIMQMLMEPEGELLLNQRDGMEMTPLHYAVFNKNRSLAEILITSGAKIPEDLRKDCPREMQTFIENCAKTYQSMLYATKHSITSSSELNDDLSGIVIGFLSKFEMRNTFGVSLLDTHFNDIFKDEKRRVTC